MALVLITIMYCTGIDIIFAIILDTVSVNEPVFYVTAVKFIILHSECKAIFVIWQFGRVNLLMFV